MFALSVGNFASVLPVSLRSAGLYRVNAATSLSLSISVLEFELSAEALPASITWQLCQKFLGKIVNTNRLA